MVTVVVLAVLVVVVVVIPLMLPCSCPSCFPPSLPAAVPGPEGHRKHLPPAPPGQGLNCRAGCPRWRLAPAASGAGRASLRWSRSHVSSAGVGIIMGSYNKP